MFRKYCNKYYENNNNSNKKKKGNHQGWKIERKELIRISHDIPGPRLTSSWTETSESKQRVAQ